MWKNALILQILAFKKTFFGAIWAKFHRPILAQILIHWYECTEGRHGGNTRGRNPSWREILPQPRYLYETFFSWKTPTDLKFCILFLLPLSFSSSSLTAVCLCLSLPQSLPVSYLSLSSLTSPISLMSSTPTTSPRSPRLSLAPTPSLVSIYLSLSVFF